LLTAGNPEGDVLFGIDNNLLARALAGDVFEAYESPELSSVDPSLVLDPEHRVTPIDRGDVCLNVDKTWFSEHGLVAPTSLDQLTLPRYRNLLVVENPATSTPGLAFMLATIAKYGDGWQDYWRTLRQNGVLVVDGWEDAYFARFTGAAGSSGKRPIVVSYASSPPADVFAEAASSEAPTGSWRTAASARSSSRVSSAARRTRTGAKLIDFMLSKRFQEDIPLQMYVFPARTRRVSPEFERFAVVPAIRWSSRPRRSRRTESGGWTSGRTSWCDERPRNEPCALIGFREWNPTALTPCAR
jgi:thiamine transport system substrate-binding protein